MDWKSIGGIVGKAAPLLGGLLGGPAGAAAGTLVAGVLGVKDTPEAVSEAIKADPQALVKLKEAHLTHKKEMAEISLKEKQMIVDSGSRDLETVNTTIRTEATSDKWWVSGWRPFNGFMFGITLFSVYFFLPFLNGFSWFNSTVPKVDYFVWLAWASVLGVASWHRGMKQRLDSGEVGAPGIMGALANRIKR